MYVSADGKGLPMRPKELAGRKGKQPTARPRPAKFIWAVFSRSIEPIKKAIPCGTMNPRLCFQLPIHDLFGPILRQDALRRGLGTAGKVVLLIDGAKGLENMGKDCFKDSVQIVDFYHAVEHAGLVLDALLGKNHPEHKVRQHRWAKRLLKDKVENLIVSVNNDAVETEPRLTPLQRHGCAYAGLAGLGFQRLGSTSLTS